VWLSVRATQYLNDSGEFSGLQLNEVLSWSFEKRTRFKKSQYPELWIQDGMPAIECGKSDLGPINFEFPIRNSIREGISMEILVS
jgi:hypothetical protein